jgi:hypothetical protein
MRDSMKPECQLLFSQKSCAGPCPEPVESNLLCTYKVHLNIILPRMPRYPNLIFSLRFPHQNC